MTENEGSPVAVLLIDVINGFDFEGCEPLVRAATQAAPRILSLTRRARAAGVPVIYVNDNFGQWRSDFKRTVDECSRPERPGHQVTRQLLPEESDYFVLKPRHSGFYCTALELLLQNLQTKLLIMVGFAANICVLFTANDAHMRGLDVWVPSDCVGSNSPELTSVALEQMKLVSSARIDPSDVVDFEALKAGRS